MIDAKGRLVVTVGVMDLAASEMLQASYLDGGVPKELSILEADGCWSVYLAVRWLTPAAVQAALQRLGTLLGRSFVFDLYRPRNSKLAIGAMRGRCARARSVQFPPPISLRN